MLNFSSKLMLLIAVFSWGTGCGNTTNSGHAPEAVLKIPSIALVGSWVLFDASSSADKDGLIVSYVFSVDNLKPDHVQTDPKLFWTFENTGKHTVRLTVYDDEGYSDTDERTMSVVTELPSFEPDAKDAASYPDETESIILAE
jgi:hypothetical protein